MLRPNYNHLSRHCGEQARRVAAYNHEAKQSSRGVGFTVQSSEFEAATQRTSALERLFRWMRE